MNNISQDFNRFSVGGSNDFEPKMKRPMPFPLENLDEEIADAYNQVDLILKKIEAAKKNPINNTPARKSRVESLRYKAKTCLHLLKSVYAQYQDLHY